jgi:inner membrane protein
VDPITHVATGVLISQLVPTPSRFWAGVAGAAFALIPDVDYFLVWTDRLAFIRYHRGFTHSLIAIPVLALCGAGVGAAIGGKAWFRPIFLLGLAVLASHLFLDLATSYGTQLFSPLSRRKFALDWIFIIDPYFTFILLAGVLAAISFPGWGRRVGAVCLAGAAAYLLICGYYHQQALNLARQVFKTEAGAAVAALPQPFSCRRWQLIAARPREIKIALVQLPFLARPGVNGGVKEVRAAAASLSCPRAPAAAYRPPNSLIIQNWRAASAALPAYSAEARHLLKLYLDFARFPLLARAETLKDGFLLDWVDLRFSVPGRAFPFVLQLHLDPEGRLLRGDLGRCVEKQAESGGRAGG